MNHVVEDLLLEACGSVSVHSLLMPWEHGPLAEIFSSAPPSVPTVAQPASLSMPQEASSLASSVKSLRAPDPGSPGIKGSPERGFLGALLKQEEGLTAEEAESRQLPQKNTKKTAGKPKANQQGQGKGSGCEHQGPCQEGGWGREGAKNQGQGQGCQRQALCQEGG